MAPPWWLAAPTTLATPDVVGPSPLPAVPKSEDIKGEANGLGERATPADTRWCLIQALDGNPGRIWWYCAGCGRINQRDMLIHRRCRSCQVRLVCFYSDAWTLTYVCPAGPRGMKRLRHRSFSRDIHLQRRTHLIMRLVA